MDTNGREGERERRKERGEKGRERGREESERERWARECLPYISSPLEEVLHFFGKGVSITNSTAKWSWQRGARSRCDGTRRTSSTTKKTRHRR
jgi:hypothetical protein